MANSTSQSIEEWLRGIDASLVEFKDDFVKLHVHNTNCLRYMKQSDFVYQAAWINPKKNAPHRNDQTGITKETKASGTMQQS